MNLVWEEMAEAPVARLDGAAVQIKHLLYVFSGYANIDEVVKFISTSLHFKGPTHQEKSNLAKENPYISIDTILFSKIPVGRNLPVYCT